VKRRRVECVCLVCQKSFSVRLSYRKRGEGKYCSRVCYYSSMKGRTCSEGTKRKIGKANTGKKNFFKGNRRSLENRMENSGKKSHLWRGGITPINLLIRSNSESKEWRERVYKRDAFTCQQCFDNKGGNLHAHHREPFSKLLNDFLQEYNQFSPIEDKETLIRLSTKWQPFWDVGNGITLCRKCHEELHKSRNFSISRQG
jgi:hypothetical protein